MDTRTLELMELEEMERRIKNNPKEKDHHVEVSGTDAALKELKETIEEFKKTQK